MGLPAAHERLRVLRERISADEAEQKKQDQEPYKT
jgi:hypothetical protein